MEAIYLKHKKLLAVLLAVVMTVSLAASLGVPASAYDDDYTLLFSGEADPYTTWKYSYTNINYAPDYDYRQITIVGGKGDPCDMTDYPVPFATRTDAAAVQWTYNTTGYERYFWVDPDSIEVIPYGTGYAFAAYVAVNLDSDFNPGPLPVGPYSLHFYLPDTNAYADFTFVLSDETSDPGDVTTGKNGIAYHYNGALIAWGDMPVVPASAFYSIIPGYFPRSYVTAMDAVAQSQTNRIIQFYNVTTPPPPTPPYPIPDAPGLYTIEDNNDEYYPGSYDPAAPDGWLYGVYKYSPAAGQPDYLLDPLSKVVGPDDYLLEDIDKVIWNYGTICDYDDLFPERIDWPPVA
jgi:hypothetical protein